MHPEPFSTNPQLRASDADREEAAAMLGAALAEGRLSVTEHSERLDAVYQAKTHAEIVPLIKDLPAQGVPAVPAVRASAEPAARRRHRIIAIFAGATRKGEWHAEAAMSALTVFGGATIDFREASLPQREVTLNCTSVFGGMEVIVLPGMRVIDSGVAVFGGRDVDASGPAGDQDAPVLRLTGFTVFGGLEVRHKQRRARDRLPPGAAD